MIILAVIFSIVAFVAAGIYSQKDEKGNIKLSKKGKRIAAVVIVAAIILAFLFFAFSFISESGSSAGSSSNKWDELTEEEKDWYRDNYGDGQYDKYQNAINDYKNRN